MFKIPDWEEDIPKSTVNFEKKAKRKKENVPTKSQTPKNIGIINKKVIPKAKNLKIKLRSPSTNLKQKLNNMPKENFVKTTLKHNNLKAEVSTQPKINNKTKNHSQNNINKTKTHSQNNGNKHYVTAPSKNENNSKENSRKRKLDSQPINTKKNKVPKKDQPETEYIEITNLDLEKADEVLLDAKKKKLNEAYKIKSEDSLFGRKKKLNKKDRLKKVLESNRSSIVVSGNKLRQRMLERLKAAQFRYLNEKLYTSSGSEAQELFQSDPSAFQTYHQGYQQQLKKWPVNPLDVIVKKIIKLPKTHVIADLGCGEAALSRRVPHSVRSFDLVATAPGVEVCDMAHTPLLAASIDVVVYCLALMGTELTQYIVEANRILKQSGHLLIAEVESRFDNVDNFARDIEKLGFKLKSVDKTNKVFFFLQFVKNRDPPKKGKPELSLKPCLYKKR